MLREKMPWIGHNPLMRIAERGSFCLTTAILAILCTLVLATGARADEPAATPAMPGATEGQGPGEGQPAGPGGQSEETQGGGVLPQEAGQETPLSGGEASGGSGGVAGEEAAPVAGESGEGAPSSPGAGETKEPAPVEVPPVVEQTVQEPANEVVVTKTGQEGQESGAAALLHGSSADSGAAQDSVARAASGGETAGESQALIAGPLSPPPAAPMAGAGEAQAPATLVLGGGENGPRGGMTAAQRAGALSCELSALGGRTTDNCTVGWLGEKRFIAGSSTVSFGSVEGSLAVAMTGALPPGGGHGGSAVGNAPASPTPGPAPSGASGAAVGGASGIAPSAFLSLAGLLLLAAPRAMRRLRLSSRPWLTACFVLIPERPG
jgi:hypothetical protein